MKSTKYSHKEHKITRKATQCDFIDTTFNKTALTYRELVTPGYSVD